MIVLIAFALAAASPDAGGGKADRASLGVENLNGMRATKIRRFGDTFKVKITPRQLEVARLAKAFVHNFGPVQQEEIRQVAREMAAPCTLATDQFDFGGRLASKLECQGTALPAGLEIVANASRPADGQ